MTRTANLRIAVPLENFAGLIPVCFFIDLLAVKGEAEMKTKQQ